MNRPSRTWLLRMALLLALVAAFAIGFVSRGKQSAPSTTTSETSQHASTWTCSMHPQIQLPQPGACPICGMDLIEQNNHQQAGEGPRSLTLSPQAAAIANIQTTRVERRHVETTLRLIGKLEPDESRIREIAAWVDGRIERLHIDYTGVPVQAGQPLFELYSPDLYSAQEELLQAIRSAEALQQSSIPSSRRSAVRTVKAARERLRLWGLTQKQIEEIETRGSASELVTIVAPMSGTVLHKAAVEGSYVETGTHVYAIADLSVLWLKLDVYEADLSWIQVGQKVRFTTDTHAGERFEGTVAFIDPVLDQRSHSVKVRVDVQNADGRLKPGMFARATVYASVGASDAEPPMVIPRTAPLITGTRALVYVADPEQPGRFHGREVVLGREAGEVVVVQEGLEVGELVVSNGSFKIDSAMQIMAKPSMMNPSTRTQGFDGVPETFHRQLEPLLATYFEVSHALSHDNLTDARAAARKLPAAVRSPQVDLLPGQAQDAFRDLQRKVTAATTAIDETNSIETARRAYYSLSEAMIRLVRLFGASGNNAIHVYHCPMARDGRGADWLQDFTGTENPYYGSAMFRCGELTETLIEPPRTAPDSSGNNR